MDPVTVKIRDIANKLEQSLPNAWSSTLLRQRPHDASLLLEAVRIFRALEKPLEHHVIGRILDKLLHIFHGERQEDGLVLKAAKWHLLALAVLRLVQAHIAHIARVAPNGVCAWSFSLVFSFCTDTLTRAHTLSVVDDHIRYWSERKLNKGSPWYRYWYLFETSPIDLAHLILFTVPAPTQQLEINLQVLTRLKKVSTSPPILSHVCGVNR